MPAANTNEKDSYNAKSLVFYGEKFDYWRDRIESFFLGYDIDLWEMVIKNVFVKLVSLFQ